MKKIYLSPVGVIISALMMVVGRVFRPFMIYGYWNAPTNQFRKLTRISSTAVLMNRAGIDIEDNCWVWHHSIIDGSCGVKIGRGTQIGAWVGVFTHSSHVAIRLHGEDYINIDSCDRKGYVRAAVEIGEYVFVGAGAKILPGVKIGRGALVAAGAVVSKDVPEFSVVAGNPAKVVASTLKMDEKYFDDPYVREHYFARDVIEAHVASGDGEA